MLINDTQYELLALGLMINNAEAAQAGVSDLTEEHFTDINFRTIFRAVFNLVNAEKDVNIYNVNQELKSIGQVLSLDELVSIEDKFYFPEKFASIVQTLEDRRKKLFGIDTLRQTLNRLSNSGDNYEDIIKEVDSLSSLSLNTSSVIIAKENYIEIREQHDKSRIAREGLKTYYYDIDDLLTYKLGLGEISIIAARPGNGKSTFKTNLINNVCTHSSNGVVSYALEQTPLVESDRLESLLSRIPIQDVALLHKWEKSDPRWEQLLEARKKIATWNYYLISGFGKTFGEMRNELRVLKRSGVKLVFWDLFDRIKEVSESVHNKPQMISKMCQQFLSLANELEMHFSFLVQLNRRKEERKDPKPLLHDLKEAGAYEEVARLVFLLHSPGHYDTSLVNPPIQVDIAKQNSGPKATIDLAFDSKCLLLSSEGTESKGIKLIKPLNND